MPRLVALLASMAVACLSNATQAATTTSPANVAAPSTISFASLGAGTIELHGGQTIGGIAFGTRRDQVVTKAKLRLRITYSPALLPELSHLRVSLNGQTLEALPLPKEQAGRETEREVDIDPRYFSDYNQLRFDLVGHYTLQCEDPQHSSLWLTINPQSSLELTLRALELRNDLSLLPAPFFDRRDNQRLVLPMWLPAQASTGLIHAAGVAASWFGMLADYRSARFPVTHSTPQQHALVFATNQSRPAQLNLAAVSKPTISMLDNPENPQLKLLVFQGQDDAQLEQAVTALVLGNPIFSGNQVTVTGVKPATRAAYDVPRWLRTDRPVKLGELVDSASQLQASGSAPAPINVNLRLPPDLFTWNRTGVPVNLHYRYTAPNERDNSMLSISVNNQLLRSFRLQPDSESDSGGKLHIPLLSGADAQQRDSLLIPAFQLASNNQMQFQFALDYHHDGLCREVFTDQSREAIDPDSTIDLTDFSHYTALPNLALFANAGFPFTRYADLSQTAIVLPDSAAGTLEQLFFILGRMGRHTGAAATAFKLLDTEQARHANHLDLLLLSGHATNRLLTQWQQDLALRINDGERVYRDGNPAPAFLSEQLRLTRDRAAASEIAINANGSLGAFISFESPLSGKRTVVALTASDDDAAQGLINVLEDDGKVAMIRGDLAIVRADNVQSYQGDEVYYVGLLSWWQWLWFHLSLHPVLLTLLALGMAVAVAMLAYGWLQRRQQARLPSEL